MGRAIVVGGGPAGASLAFLLADRGIDVVLVERQRDFAREFRGEVLMPSGVEALREMGLGEALRAVPTAAPDSLEVFLNRRSVARLALVASRFDGRPPLAVSQTALLEAIVAEAAKRPTFRFLRATGARDLLFADGRACGVRVHAGDGESEVHGDFVVGADGRASIVRRRGGLDAMATAPPMDIVWCKLPALAGFRGARGYLGRGHLLIAYHTWDDRLQVAWAILKGTFGELRRRGIEEWVEEMAHHVTDDLAAHLRVHAGAVVHPFLLDTVSDRVLRWSAPGLLVIGDAAHTMSPVGGQGLNVALRDAIVAANQLVPALRGAPSPAALDAAAQHVEMERLPEIARVQRAQALPPRVVLARAWWGEPLRRALAFVSQTGIGRAALAREARVFAFGANAVRLTV